MMNKTLLTALCFFSTLAVADELNFSVTNLSKSVITFGSTDYFDTWTAVNFNETQNHTYTNPPKNMRIVIGNGPYASFYMMTDPSCDALGFKPLREMTKIKPGGLSSSITKYKAGKVYITISDMDNSTVNEKKIQCSQSIH